MYPVYGLAEASLAVSFPPVGAPLKTIMLNRHRMNPGDPVEPIPAHDPQALQLVSEGKAIPYAGAPSPTTRSSPRTASVTCI